MNESFQDICISVFESDADAAFQATERQFVSMLASDDFLFICIQHL